MWVNYDLYVLNSTVITTQLCIHQKGFKSLQRYLFIIFPKVESEALLGSGWGVWSCDGQLCVALNVLTLLINLYINCVATLVEVDSNAFSACFIYNAQCGWVGSMTELPACQARVAHMIVT